MATSLKNNSLFTSITILSVIMLTLIGGIILTTVTETDVTTSDEQSWKNIEIYREAAKKGDPSLCNRIEGGINEINRSNRGMSVEYRFKYGQSTRFKQMNERQAEKECRANAERAVERTKRLQD